MSKKVNVFFLLIMVFILASNVYLLYKLHATKAHIALKAAAKEKTPESLSCAEKLEYIQLLLSHKMQREAVDYSASYLSGCCKDRTESVDFALKTGDICMDIQDYSKALSYYLYAQVLTKEAPQKAIEQKISAAQEKIAASTPASQSPLSQKGRVIARIGKEELHEGVIDDLLQDLSDEEKAAYAAKGEKDSLIKDYVVQKVLFARAQRLGIVNDPKVKKTSEAAIEQITVEALIEKELASSRNVSEEELKAYYAQHKTDFVKTNDAAVVSAAVFFVETGKDAALQRLRTKPDLDDIRVERTATSISGIGDAAEIIPQLLSLDKGAQSQAYKIHDKMYVFLIKDKIPPTYSSFEEIKGQLAEKYSMEKEAKLFTEYIDKAMKEEDAELYVGK